MVKLSKKRYLRILKYQEHFSQRFKIIIGASDFVTNFFFLRHLPFYNIKILTNETGHLIARSTITLFLPTITMSRLQRLHFKSIFQKTITVGGIGVQRRSPISFLNYPKLYNWGTKKSATHVKLVYYPEGMAEPQVEEILAPLRAAVKKQVSASYLFMIFKCLSLYLFLG